MKSLLTPLALLTLTASTASACLNDREVIVAESEFRSAYAKAPEPKPLLQRIPVGGWIGAIAGAGLITTAFLTVRKSR